MTRDDVQRWLDRYVAAWMAYDPAAIGELFSADARYRYHPWDEPLVGRDAIVHDCRAVAVGDTTYRDIPGGPISRGYENVWLIEFDDEGRCRSFVEYFMKQKR